MAIKIVGGHFTKNLTEQVVKLFGYEEVEKVQCTKEKLIELIKSKEFDTLYLNDYQEDVVGYLDLIDAKIPSCIDTIVYRNNKVIGYNYSYLTFMNLLKDEVIKDKRVFIIGNTYLSKVIKQVCIDKCALEIFVLDEKDEQSYVDAYASHMDANILINTSSIGQGKDSDSTPIDLSLFSDLEHVYDCIYNPIWTQLILEAKKRNIQYTSGLPILTNQIRTVLENRLDMTISNRMLYKVTKTMVYRQVNIVLIGMPSAGKSTIGKLLKKRVRKDFIDMDAVIVKKTKMKIPDIFAKSKEAGFRKIESMVSHEMGLQNGIIIGTGGGTIKTEYNMDCLRRNGVIVFIDRDLENLISYDPNRPLSSSKEAVQKLYEERYPLYTGYADIHIPNNGIFKDTIFDIIKEYRIYISRNIK